MQRNKNSLSSWKIRDVILIGLIGVIFGILFFIFGMPWTTFVSLSAPLGSLIAGNSLAQSIGSAQVAEQVANAATIGLWVMGGPISALIVKKAGSAVLGETLAAVIEMAIGSVWGVSNIVYGIVQGVGSEIGFAITGYKKNLAGLWLSTLTSTILIFVFVYFRDSYNKLPLGYVFSLFVISYVSVLVFSGILVYLIYKILEKSHLIK
ncbi:ECF transporter S component [Oenococcus alcoholitolerans]|uniref:Transporter n=1 Tax=Oenococcus alcoholitolerans TaxID=931074 RepID=A0ABR4XSF2_9LACO|nr:transporter [Oenococcus alcoholitolerans]